MKSWVPVLVNELSEGRNPVLAVAGKSAQVAVFDRSGKLLTGTFGSALASWAVSEISKLEPGHCLIIDAGGPMGILTLECLLANEKTLGFWRSAWVSQQDSWSAWVLTVPRSDNGQSRLVRHLLSAYGPWVTPKLPGECADGWSLLPLNPGLGKLFVIGDQPLAAETVGLAAHTGLSVIWISTLGEQGPGLAATQKTGDFKFLTVPSFDILTNDYLTEIGLVDGVKVVVVAGESLPLRTALTGVKTSYLAWAGADNFFSGGQATGIFVKPATLSQQALGLVAEMLAG